MGRFPQRKRKKGIRNDKDPFTPSGNRRTFTQLHDFYSVENIVKNMLRGEQTGKGGFFGHNANSIASRLANEFKSIADIKEASALLTVISEGEYDALMNKTFEVVQEIIDEIDTVERRILILIPLHAERIFSI